MWPAAIFLWIIITIVAGIVANNKNRSVEGWVLLSFLFPLVVLILLALPPAPIETQLIETKSGPIKSDSYKKSGAPCEYCGKEIPGTPASANKKCPFCAETIKQEAVVCKHCGRNVPK